jgi:hypothetical protein
MGAFWFTGLFGLGEFKPCAVEEEVVVVLVVVLDGVVLQPTTRSPAQNAAANRSSLFFITRNRFSRRERMARDARIVRDTGFEPVTPTVSR